MRWKGQWDNSKMEAKNTVMQVFLASLMFKNKVAAMVFLLKSLYFFLRLFHSQQTSYFKFFCIQL